MDRHISLQLSASARTESLNKEIGCLRHSESFFAASIGSLVVFHRDCIQRLKVDADFGRRWLLQK
jgi:hypothetical protein